MERDGTGMREKLLGTLIGFAFGVNLASAIFNMLVSQNSQAASVEKGFLLLICLFIVLALSFIGFESGRNHSYCVE